MGLAMQSLVRGLHYPIIHESTMLADDLRTCAAATVDAFTPHWQDTAKRLMRQAADALDAADRALRENYERDTEGQPK